MDVILDVIVISTSFFLTKFFLSDLVTNFSSHLIFSALVWGFILARSIQKQELNLRYLYHTVCSLAVWTIIIVLLGASFDKLDNLMSVSLLASVYTLPYTFTSYLKKQKSPPNLSLYIVLLFGWLGAFPMFLDWNQPWHSWPNPVIWGLHLGHLVEGTVNYFVKLS